MATDYTKLKVADLRVELKNLGLPQTGLKAELVARLDEAQRDNAEAASPPVESATPQTADPSLAAEGPPLLLPADVATTQLSATQTPADASVTSAPTEIRQDYQDRHERSGSPPPQSDTIMQEPERMAECNDDDGDENAIMQDAPTPDERSGLDPAANAHVVEKDIGRSIHPATNALYVKNLMRPLRPQDVRDYLAELATPPDSPQDDNLVKDFFLDAVKTHAFVVFSSTAAASRVRSRLHDRVWPNETNRKPLWIDFIPPDRFQDFVATEEGAGGRSNSRWEIEYVTGKDQIEAELVDVATGPRLHDRPRSISPRGGEHLSAIPTGPAADSYVGVQGAPTGPRNLMEPQGRFGRQELDRAPFDRQGGPRRDFDADMVETRTYPGITFKPVSRDLADSRLDAIAKAKSKFYNDSHLSGASKEYRRYYFDNGDMLVDRGPEIFLGIRPPHRERERQREMGNFSGGGGGGGGGFGRRGGGRGRGGGGGRGRHPRRHGGGGGRGGGPGDFAMHHGVPRGGDRFRPPPRQGARGPDMDGGSSRYGRDRY
ncbi:SAP domain-containing protein [Microdochium nivale]|nr:SAP domain-containing protein [Microdochium nivale]